MGTALGGITSHGRDKATPVTKVLDVLGLDDALWVLANAAGPEGARLCHVFACDAAEHVLHIWDRHCPSDKRPQQAIEAKRAWLDGKATDKELAAAGAAAGDAEREWQIQHLRGLLEKGLRIAVDSVKPRISEDPQP